MSISSGEKSGYKILTGAGLRGYLAQQSDLRDRLGGTPDLWSLREVSDGNLNLVHLVDGPLGRICVKQALPHVRVDESWVLPLDRGANESAYLRAVLPHVGRLAPALYAYDAEQTLIVMEALSPHRIFREDLIHGRRVSGVAQATASYVARASFFTSDLFLRLEDKFDLLSSFTGNHALKRITAELIFRDPYYADPRNRWTSPHLDGLVAEIRADGDLKRAASRLGTRFLSESQALIHGDLHTGSIMATDGDARVIDGEFASFGPIGLDLGAFAANLLMAYFAQSGLDHGDEDYGAWILQQLADFWTLFRDEFLGLWQQHGRGDAYPSEIFTDRAGQAALEQERDWYLNRLFADLLGFAGAKIIRRITGFAHVADFETISDPAIRAMAEARALRLAIRLVKTPDAFPSIEALLAAVRREAAHV